MLGFYGLYAKIISIKNNKTPEIFQLVCNEYKIYESYFFYHCVMENNELYHNMLIF